MASANTDKPLIPNQEQPAEQGAEIIDIQKGKEQIAKKARPTLKTTVEAPQLKGVKDMIDHMSKISLPVKLRSWAKKYESAKLLSLTITEANYWSSTEVHPEAPEDQLEELTKLAEAFDDRKDAIEEDRAKARNEKNEKSEEKNEFEARIKEAIDKINASDIIRQKRDKKTREPIPNAPEGIVEFCQSYVDEGYMKYQGGKYIYSGNLRARAVAEAANDRIKEINSEFFLRKKLYEYNEMRHKKNGYPHDIDGNQFAFQVASAGEVDNQVIVKVVDLVVVKGKAPFAKGDAKPYTDCDEIVRLAYDALMGDKESPYYKNPRRPSRNKKGARKESFNSPRMKDKKKVEAKIRTAKAKPEPTAEEKAITDAIKDNPELKIINQFLGAFAKNKKQVDGVELGHEAIETIIRRAVDIIDVDAEEDDEKDDVNEKTPKSHQDLADLDIAPDVLPAIAKALRKDLEQQATG